MDRERLEETHLDWIYDDCGVDGDNEWLIEYIKEAERIINFIWILNSENELYIELKHQEKDQPF